MFHRVLAISLLAAAAAFAQSTTATTRQFSFPLTSLGSTETMQINLLNTASNSTSGTAASCTGSVSFLNSSGTVIGSATAFTLASGQLNSISLPFAKAGISGNRGIVRAVISETRASGVPCSLVFSLETFDTSSGATHIFLPQADGGGGAGFPGGGPGR